MLYHISYCIVISTYLPIDLLIHELLEKRYMLFIFMFQHVDYNHVSDELYCVKEWMNKQMNKWNSSVHQRI